MNPPGRYFFTIALKLNCKLVQLKRTSRTGLMEKNDGFIVFLNLGHARFHFGNEKAKKMQIEST